MSSAGLRWKFLDQTLILHPAKAMFWEEEQALIVSDLHIGKVGHFRKAGIAIPRLMEQEELATLSDLINEYRPARVIFLGDLFHSDMNNDWNWLQLWRELFSEVHMTLVQGNHDILNLKHYSEANVEVCHTLKLGPFLFLHDKSDASSVPENNLYILSGHVHPAVKLRGKARQSLLLTCFYFGKNAGILPAFGKFTGKCCLKVVESDQVFAVMQKKVMQINTF